jgi:uncharacterized protein YidB (DUF937 family)
MLDKLIDLVRGNSQDAIINNNNIPNDKNDVAVKSAGNSILSTLQNALSGGKISEVLNYFKNGGNQDNEIVKEATGNYANDLQNNLGIGAAEASQTASKVIPGTMNQLASQTADPANKDFNIQDIFNQLSGGKTGSLNIQEMLNKFTGGKLDKDGDGDLDLQDLKVMFSGSGGVMDKVKGMFS